MLSPEKAWARPRRAEIIEETGFEDVLIGDVAWRGEQVLRDRKGRPVLFQESYLIARCGGGEPSRDGWQALEREFVDDIRWWAMDDLAACAEPVFPAGLAERVRGLAGEPARLGQISPIPG